MIEQQEREESRKPQHYADSREKNGFQPETSGFAAPIKTFRSEFGLEHE